MALVYLKVTEDFVIDDHELEWQFSTSSGPGAQRRILSERFGQLITIRVDTHRSQKRNREEARDRLAAKIRQGLQVPTSRRNTRPSRSAKRKRVDAKARRGQLKKQRQRPSIDD